MKKAPRLTPQQKKNKKRKGLTKVLNDSGKPQGSCIGGRSEFPLNSDNGTAEMSTWKNLIHCCILCDAENVKQAHKRSNYCKDASSMFESHTETLNDLETEPFKQSMEEFFTDHFSSGAENRSKSHHDTRKASTQWTKEEICMISTNIKSVVRRILDAEKSDQRLCAKHYLMFKRYIDGRRREACSICRTIAPKRVKLRSLQRTIQQLSDGLRCC